MLELDDGDFPARRKSYPDDVQYGCLLYDVLYIIVYSMTQECGVLEQYLVRCTELEYLLSIYSPVRSITNKKF